MSGLNDDILHSPPSTPIGGTPIRSRTPPSWVSAPPNSRLEASHGNGNLTRMSPLQRQQRVVSPMLVDRSQNNVSINGRQGNTSRERLILNYEAVINRVRSRSNSLNHAQRRFESPISITPNRALIREEEDVNQQEDQDGVQRLSAQRSRLVRIGAGSAVGTTSYRIAEEHSLRSSNRAVTPSRSIKQKPSHRKIRRWNNDNLVGIASEIAKTHRDRAKGEAYAKAFLEGQAEAHLNSQVTYPVEYRSAFKKLSEDKSIDAQIVRERFLKGEVASNMISKKSFSEASSKFTSASTTTPAIMYSTINARLRNILEKSYNSTTQTLPMQLITWFELHLLSVLAINEYDGDKSNLSEETLTKNLDKVLQQRPKITLTEAKKRKIQYYFDSKSPTGAYHRLLLHAVCKFHGLNSVSSDASNVDDNKSKRIDARVLTVTGSCQLPNSRLIDHLEHLADLKERQQFLKDETDVINSGVVISEPIRNI